VEPSFNHRIAPPAEASVDLAAVLVTGLPTGGISYAAAQRTAITQLGYRTERQP
jgi:hypothetical protein